ncbi:Quino protein amine dehydrogenase [Dactylonectria macrodidyma]|uniref:Quino protein amine dehydrogenase n=1 Tax=Dactylonectria macrodidyma TaxID=307937 RepID=A0A9P9JCT1_9HYPO|nr:Quino protein amine dehydrogenase [Dactylonectria macrodidyma]
MGGDNLSPLCATLLTAATGTSDALSDFIIGYPVSRPALGMLSRELSEMQLVARLLGHNAEEDAVALLPPNLSVTLRAVVEAAGLLVEDINDALNNTEQPSQAWREHTAERLAPLGRLVESSRTAMNLGLDTLLYTVNFQPASRSELPPYNSSQLLQEARDLRAKLDADAESDDARVQTHQPGLIEFVQALQEYMDQSGSLGVGFNERSLAPVTGTSASSLHSEVIPPIPDYNALGIANHAPLTISLRHVAKKELPASDIVELAFLRRKNRPIIAVSTMAPPTRFLDMSAIQIHGFNTQHGVSMVFDNDGTSWAYLCEEDPKDLTPQGHDGVNFKRPVVHLGDYVSGRRVQQMRWPGVKPLGFSPDSRWLAVGSARNRIALIDIMSGAVLHKSRVISCHQDEVTHAVFTPDSKVLISQSRDGTIRLTAPETGKALAKLDTDTWKKPLFLGVSTDGDVIVSIRGDTVYHWNHETSDVESYSLGSRRTREGWPIAISRDCRFLCCRNDEGVDISDLYSGKVLYTIKFQSGYATAAAFSLDGRYLVLGKASSWMGVRVTTSTLDIWELLF